MPIYTQITNLPIFFRVDQGAIYSVKNYLSENNLIFSKILILSGSTFSFRIAKKFIEGTSLKVWKHDVISSDNISEVDRLRELVYQNSVDLIIGIGGGKVIDVTKRLSLVQRTNCVFVPTMISNDGLISPISVLTTKQGKKISIAGQMPLGVIIDNNIVRGAPKMYLQAAAGDILSNFSALFDWKLSNSHQNEQINDIAYQMSEMAAFTAINFSDISLSSNTFLQEIINAQFMSGIAMAVAGTSRPCSGSEHLISHAIDFLNLSNETLHGLQVGSASLFCLYLQNQLNNEHLNYAKTLGLPLKFTTLTSEIPKNILEVFTIAKEMRPERYTILNQFTGTELLKKYQLFEESINQNML